jgi:hypothetical protein
MRLLPCFALLTLAATTQAQDFDFSGIPADHAIVVASTGTRGLRISESPEARALKAKLEQFGSSQSKAQQEMAAALRVAAGIDLQSPDNHFAMGLTPLGEGRFTGGMIFHVRHDSDKLAAYGTAQNIPILSAGGLSGWRARELVSSFGGAGAQMAKTAIASAETSGDSEPVGVFDVDAETLIIAKPREAARMIALLKGQGVSYALTPQSKAQTAKTGRPYVIMAMNAAKLPPSPAMTKSGLQDALVVIGEDAADQVLKVTTGFADEAKATPYVRQAQGMLAMMPLMMAGNPIRPQSAEDKEMKEIFREMLAGVRPIEHSGAEIGLSASWETARLCTMMGRLLELNAAKMGAAQAAESGK